MRDGRADSLATAREVAAATGQVVEAAGEAAFGAHLVAARFRLGNGLTVVLASNRRAPIFAYQTWFRVGSKDEDPNATGLAHLFEHLMFKGTRRHPVGAFDREMERRGAQTNAATWVDWTYYTQALAARDDNLATVIAFEADRMHNLVLDQQTFASELEVVKNERRMSVEDSVTGELSEVLMAEAFRHHPYRWPTIGSMEHLRSARVADLEAFYRRFYSPANAAVVVVGDIDWRPTLTAIATAYGLLAAAQPGHRTLPKEPPQRQPRHRVLHRSVTAPQMLVGYRAVAEHEPDFPALQMLMEVLVAGDAARLYQRLVIDQEVASEVTGSVHPFAEPGLCEFYLALRPGVDGERALALLQEVLDDLGGDGPTAVEVDKARHGLELSVVETLSDVEGCAEALGHFESTQRDCAAAFRQAERLAQVVAADLVRVAQQTFRAAGRTSVLALPRSLAA